MIFMHIEIASLGEYTRQKKWMASFSVFHGFEISSFEYLSLQFSFSSVYNINLVHSIEKTHYQILRDCLLNRQ